MIKNFLTLTVAFCYYHIVGYLRCGTSRQDMKARGEGAIGRNLCQCPTDLRKEGDMNWQRILILPGLILILAGLSACGPDLMVVPVPEYEGPPNTDDYCRLNPEGLLLVVVRNSGDEDVTIWTATRIQFYDPSFGIYFDPIDLDTPPLAVGEKVLLGPAPAPDTPILQFYIKVDAYNEVDEGYGFWEINNEVSGVGSVNLDLGDGSFFPHCGHS